MKKFLLFAIIMLSSISIVAQDANQENATLVKGNWTATYYGDRYKGSRRNANGEPFDMNAMTCAAPRQFPFGTRLRVTNTANGKSVVVRVCDRPAPGHTIIDLTHGAFGKIASHRAGRVYVKVEILK